MAYKWSNDWKKIREMPEFLRYSYYQVLMNKEMKVNQVSFATKTKKNLIRSPMVGHIPRGLIMDLRAKGFCIKNKAFKGSGFDRGHIEARRFYWFNRLAALLIRHLSNCCAQEVCLNRGAMKSTECFESFLIERFGLIHTWTGTIFEDGDRFLGENKEFGVPDKIFKVIVAVESRKGKKYKKKWNWNFCFPNNENYKALPLIDYATDLEGIEKSIEINLINEKKRNFGDRINLLLD